MSGVKVVKSARVIAESKKVRVEFPDSAKWEKFYSLLKESKQGRYSVPYTWYI
jgi:hypothetical protein